MNLNEKQLAELKEQLEKEAGELESRVKSAQKTTDFGSDVESDFSEEADEAEELSNQIGKQQAFKEHLDNVEKALDKMNRGEYGKCEKCEKDIELEVLKASPESKLCKECKAE